MAKLEIDISVKGATAGIRNLEKVTSTLEKLDDTIRLVDFNKLNKELTTIGAVFKSVSANVTGFSSELKRIDSNALKGMFSQTKVDAEKYRAELSRLRVENQELRNSLVQNKAALQGEKLAFEQGKVAQQNYRTESARLQSEITKLRLAQAQNRQQTQAVSGSYKEAQQRLTALGQAIRNYEGGFTRMTPQLRSQITEYRKLNQQLTAFDKQMGLNFRNIGNYGSALQGALPALGQMATLAGAVALAGRVYSDAFNTVKQFDSGLRNVEKTTGLAREEVLKLGDAFISLSREIQVVSATRLAEYAAVAGQLGVRGTENILAFTEALAKLETATDISGEQGATEIARTLTLIDGGVQNVAKFADEIVNLGNNFAATEKEILSNAESIAQNVGIYRIGRQDVLAFATATKAVGIEAELVGSTFNRTLATFEGAIRTGDGVKTMMQLLGSSEAELSRRFKEDSAGVFIDFIGALNRIHTAGGSVNATLEELGINAVRDQRVIQSLAANGYDVLTRAVDTSRNSIGTLNKEFGVQSQKLEAQIGRVNVAWENFILSIEKGDGALAKFTASMAGMLASTIDGFSRLVNSEGVKGFVSLMNMITNPVAFSGQYVGDNIARLITGESDRGRRTPGAFNANTFSPNNSGYDFFARQAKASKDASDAQQELSEQLIKNKAYWESQVSSIKESIEAMDISEKGTKRWIDLQKQLQTAQSSLDEYTKKSLVGGGKSSGGKTQAEIIEEANRALSRGQVGALRGVEAELLKIDNKYADIFKKIGQITDLTLRGQLMATAEVNKNIEIGQAKLDGWLKTYKKYGFNEQSVKSVSGNLSAPVLQITPEQQAQFYGRTGGAKVKANFDDKDLEKRLGRVVERGLRRGIDDIFSNITDLGSNFYEVFSGVFGKLANTITNTFGQVLSTQLGDLLSSRINNKDFSVGGLGSTASKALVAGGGLLGGILSAQGQSKVNSGLMIGGGALSGAAAGAAFGPIGAAAGLVVGAIAGIFQSSGAKKQQKLQEEALAEQRKQTKLAERAAALSFMSSIVSQQIAGVGIVTGLDRNEFGELVARVSGSDLEMVLQRNRDKR